MNPEGLFAASLRAADQFHGVRGVSILIGAALTPETIRAIAELAGVAVNATAYGGENEPTPHVIESFRFERNGVEIRGQGSRSIRPGDESLPGHLSGSSGESLETAEFLKEGLP